MSDEVEYLGSLKQDVGLTTGAKGDRRLVARGGCPSVQAGLTPAPPLG